VKEQAKLGSCRPAAGVLMESRSLFGLGKRPQFHILSAVTDSRGGSQEHRKLVSVRECHREPGEFSGLDGRRGVEHREFGGHGQEAAILLRLRAVRTGVVRHDHHEASRNAGIGGAHERIGGDVQAHLLHDHCRSPAGITVGQSHLEGHFLVDGPFQMQVQMMLALEPHQGAEDFRSRGPRIGGCHGTGRFEQAVCHGFIAKENLALFHGILQR